LDTSESTSKTGVVYEHTRWWWRCWWGQKRTNYSLVDGYESAYSRENRRRRIPFGHDRTIEQGDHIISWLLCKNRSVLLTISSLWIVTIIFVS
jgi:hypothetical protein